MKVLDKVNVKSIMSVVRKQMARPVLAEGWPRNAMTGGPKLTQVWWACERQQGQFLQPLCGRKSLKSIYRKLPHSLII